jgi:hypothetical protein
VHEARQLEVIEECFMTMAVASAYGEVVLLFHYHQTIADSVVKGLFAGA